MIEVESTTKSLNSIYGSNTGGLQSLSLLLNAGLMVYAHVGLSAVFVSNQQQLSEVATSSEAPPVSIANETVASNGYVLTGACNVTDYERWITPAGPFKYTGADNKTFESNYCARGPPNCLATGTCLSSCFEETFGYSAPCAECFGAIPGCTVIADFTCAAITCGTDPFSEACWNCTVSCNEEFAECSGLPIDIITPPWLLGNTTVDDDQPIENQTEAPNPLSSEIDLASGNTCAIQKEGVNFTSVDKYFEVYEVLFFDSMKTAWENDARLLAVIVIIFSFIWPYTKNIILMFAWYLPLSMKNRSIVLRWLRRLGKYTLVDVYVSTASKICCIISSHFLKLLMITWNRKATLSRSLSLRLQ